MLAGPGGAGRRAWGECRGGGSEAENAEIDLGLAVDGSKTPYIIGLCQVWHHNCCVFSA